MKAKYQNIKTKYDERDNKHFLDSVSFNSSAFVCNYNDSYASEPNTSDAYKINIFVGGTNTKL